MPLRGERQFIINADDFGFSAEHNAGIIAAYQAGVLNSASLMIGGDAAPEAVALARQHPTLAVGLHVTFSDTRPVLSNNDVPLLVQADGYMPPNEWLHRRALLTSPGRQQVRAEIAAQFRAFRATGLVLDHVNVHRHAHQNNPLLAWMIFREAARCGAAATRVPWDPPSDIARTLRAALLRRMGATFNLAAPDRSVGRDHWTVAELLEILTRAPVGSTELYFHPTTAANHRYSADLPTLLDRRVQRALNGLTLGGVRHIVCP